MSRIARRLLPGLPLPQITGQRELLGKPISEAGIKLQ